MKIDIYEKRARVFPALAATIVPVLLSSLYLQGVIEIMTPTWAITKRLFMAFVPTAMIYGSLGYLLREIFRWTGKYLFQFPLYKESEEKLPSTRMLLWNDPSIPETTKKCVRKKIEDKYGKQLFSKKQEEAKPKEAAIAIANVVRYMRQDTRDDQILQQYNYEFGFARNYLGASCWAILIILTLWIINTSSHLLSNWVFVICLCLQLLLGIFAFYAMKHHANAFAKQLFASFYSKC